ncbi:hypothetical protein C7964_11146 [Loktanella sp. PT4BL]|jgi:hypothetical protein|uniref:hypothetical protein n=1 Tax=Loktanella sp. PT4BL TaxID=2135611 RepID=UPI000D75247C|nr:hypothetical protein [Loktanella sp. PT4BL]PXW66245.1 hypothetical protein C7964_11146 [Loktanella sp. PT4BL]
MWKTTLARRWVHRLAATSLTILSSTLFLLNLRRPGERAGRAAERLTNLEHIDHAQREMLDAVADHPRSHDDLLDRLRRGGF